ncbi:MAG: lipoyl domain-containing protein [Leptospirales bacterium]|nr:lipoyl domain-containing protein [Leptospirales bacterium]
MSAEQVDLKVPDIGDAERIELVSWNIAQGDRVREGQELCELVTDKAAFPLEAPFDGVISALLRSVGEVVRVGDALARIERGA